MTTRRAFGPWRTMTVAMAIAAACTSDTRPSPSLDFGGDRDDASEPRWGENDRWSVSPDPRVSIGVLDGPEEYELFEVTAAARQADGDVVVVDGRARIVRLYDRQGRFRSRLGGAGAGPGEFQQPTDVLIAAGDSVIVWDDANYRITRFDSAGAFVGVTSVDRAVLARAMDPPLYPGPAVLLSTTRILVRLVEKTKNVPVGRFRPRSGALSVSVDLTSIDTLMLFGAAERVTVRAPWGPAAIEPALARRTVMAVQPAGARACIGDQVRPDIACFGPDTLRVRARWISETGPVSRQDVDRWRDTTTRLYAQKVAEAEAARLVAQVEPPVSRPHFGHLVLDRAGNLWVERDTAVDGPVEYLVFDVSGGLLGSVAVPRLRILEIGDDYILGVGRDEHGVQYLHIHELVKHVRGFTNSWMYSICTSTSW